MPPAIIAAGIATVGAVGGAVISSKAQKSAANKAAATAQTTADSNNALTKEIYGQNQAVLSPFQQRGNEAGNAINSLLGLGQPQQPQQQQVQPMQNQLASGGGFNGFGFNSPMNLGGDMPGMITGYGSGTFNMDGTQAGQSQGHVETPQADYNNAFDNYRNSTGYNFRVNEGVRALDSAASAGGVRNSGAAQKALLRYGQNVGSGEFGNYMALLANQQGVGLAGASAQAGVGQNYVNNVTANNNSAGTAAANAQLFRGQSTANMWGQIGQAAGTFASSFK